MPVEVDQLWLHHRLASDTDQNFVVGIISEPVRWTRANRWTGFTSLLRMLLVVRGARSPLRIGEGGRGRG